MPRIAVKLAESVADVLEPDPETLLVSHLAEAGAVVAHVEDKVVAVAPCSDGDQGSFLARCDRVLDGVLDERLEHQDRDGR